MAAGETSLNEDAQSPEPGPAEARDELGPAAEPAPAKDEPGASSMPGPGLEPTVEGKRRPWLLALAAAVVLVSLLGPISASGIWDPHELKVADLARRIAFNLLGGSALALEDSVNTVPTLGELARGQLPFTSVALGFRLFGLAEWAGRLPLALWGIAGVLALYALVARLADRAAGAFAALALATMPLYFLHSRTILGDIVTMSAIAIATAGLAIACFDRPSPDESPSKRRTRRALWLLLGLAGLAAGFGARGVLMGVTAPALGVGLAWLALAAAGGRARDRFGDACGALALLIGLVTVAIGLRALRAADANPTQFSMLIGAAIEKPRQLPTVDHVIHYLGHGLFPWSAVVPFAIGRLFRPPHGVNGPALDRETGLRATLILVAGVGFGVYGLMAQWTGHVAFGPVAVLAAIAALAFRDFERGAPGSRTLAMGVAALAILLYSDFKVFPEKGLSAFAVQEARFPESFKQTATKIIKYGTLGFIALFLLAFMEKSRPGERRFEREEYLRWPRLVRTLWNGNLMFGFLVAEAALIGFALLSFLSRTRFHWKQFEGMGPIARQAASWGYVALPLAVIVAPLVGYLARDAARWFFARVPVSRAVAAALAVTAFGAVLSLGYYPALAAQISPKEVFVAYKKLAQPGEQLGLLGVGAGSARYYAGRDVPTFTNVTTAFNWLVEKPERRWLVTRASDLPQLNSTYRGWIKERGGRGNLPVLDARSSEILLVSNQLLPEQRNENPFDPWILDEAPRPTHPLDANLGGQLDALGFDVTLPDGRPVDAVVPGKTYQFRIYWKVTAAISGNWETFIHIDGFQRRFNGDHPTFEGKYPFHLLRVGDTAVDIYPFSLEPNFTPGEYQVFYGLFIGSRRLEVKRGAHNDNRLDAGRLRVR
jgi:4-amino-4-deoxy-L-arabinose transferase-like glycosyltransferase